MRMNIYVDTTFDKHSKITFIGYCNPTMTVSDVKQIKASDINSAELSALCFAIRFVGVNHIFLIDSQSVVEICASVYVLHVKYIFNLANNIVSIAKENYFNNSRSL